MSQSKYQAGFDIFGQGIPNLYVAIYSYAVLLYSGAEERGGGARG